MKYILVYDCSNKMEVLTQATNMSEAIKEALVFKILDRWNFTKQSIDFNNFDTWLITWLKTTRYWDIPAIFKNVDKNRDCYGTLKENVIENLNLFDWGNKNKIYEVSDERNIDSDLDRMRGEIVGEAILKEINKIQEDNEKKEYARLKKKFEMA